MCRSPVSCTGCAVGPELIVRLVKVLEHKIEGAIDHLQLRQVRGQAGAISLTAN